MDKKRQQKLPDNILSCGENNEKNKKHEAITGLNLLKLIELSRELDAEDKVRLQSNIEIITKADQ
ncbi:MAG: hypothetical protein ACNYZG_12110 [Gammaproteobacteria bacterium]